MKVIIELSNNETIEDGTDVLDEIKSKFQDDYEEITEYLLKRR